MASLNNWTIDKSGNLSRDGYYIRPILGNRHSDYCYSYMDSSTKKIKQFKSLHGAVIAVNRIIEGV